jgi:HEAT repeat protein
MNGVTNLSVAAESAKKVCARLHQGYRDHRLYPPGHPTVCNTMEMLLATVKSHLDSLGPLVLLVGEDRLLYQGEEVYTHGENRDNLAFLMFRDGIRVLRLTPGIDAREVEALVDCLARADQMVDTDHDLSTVLWEGDLVHVEVEVVDPFLEGEGVRDDSFDELRDTVLRRLNELSSVDGVDLDGKDSGEAAKEPGAGDGGTEEREQEKLDEEGVALTEEEIERGEWLVAHPTDPLDDFAVVLLEILGSPSGLIGGGEAVFRSLSLVLGQYLDGNNLGGLDLVMNRLGLLETEGRLPKGTAETIFGQAATAERLSALIGAAASASPEKAESVEQFLARMRGSVYPALLEMLATSSDKAVRKTVLDLLRMEGGVPVRQLWPLMKDGRWYVVRNAVQLATASGDPGTAGQLEPLLRHPDSRVRREVVRSLGTLAEARCLPLLVRALQDEDSAVRTLAARGLTRQGTGGQFAAVQSQVEARDFEARSSEEVEALLVAFATLGRDQTIETLNRMWRHRMFGTRPLPLRLAAVRALGAIGSAEAGRALTEAAACGEAQLQRMAARALSELQARVKGTLP